MPITGKAVLKKGEKGGAGSGNHGHRGIPGKIGGSAPKGGAGAGTDYGAAEQSYWEEYYATHPSEPAKPATPSTAESKPATTAMPKATSTKPLPTNLNDKTAREYVAGASKVMEDAGLHPYISPHYSDSQLGGLNNSSSNVQNWSMLDGDRNNKVTSFAKPGTVEMGVAVWGEKHKVPYREKGDRLIPDSNAALAVGNKISAALKKAGYPVISVKFLGGDEGFGTKNLDYAVILKK